MILLCKELECLWKGKAFICRPGEGSDTEVHQTTTISVRTQHCYVLVVFCHLIWKFVIDPSFLDSGPNICIASGQKSCSSHMLFYSSMSPEALEAPVLGLLITLLFSRALREVPPDSRVLSDNFQNASAKPRIFQGHSQASEQWETFLGTGAEKQITFDPVSSKNYL